MEMINCSKIKSIISQAIIEIDPDMPTAATWKDDDGKIHIILNPDVAMGPCKNEALIHEAGHTYFGHLQYTSTDIIVNILAQKIRGIPEKFWKDNGFDPNEGALINLITSIVNVVQDFQVNSLIDYAKEKMDKDPVLEGGCWAEDYKFPLFDTWTNYLVNVVSDEEEFIRNFFAHLKRHQQLSGGGSGMPSKGNGSGSGKGDNQKDGSQGDQSNSGNQDSNDDGSGNESSSGNSGEKTINELLEDLVANETKKHDCIKRSQMKAASEKENLLRNENPGDSEETTETIIVDNDTSILEIMRKLLKVNVTNKKVWFSDYLYNYNRGRFTEGGLMIPKRYKKDERLIKKETYTVLIDVSGSVDKVYVTECVNAIKQLVENNKTDVAIITCNRTVQQHFKPGEKFELINVGGGTELINGIKFAAHKYPHSRLVMISDFCDEGSSISKYHEYVSKFKEMKALNWTSYDNIPDHVFKTVVRYR